MADEPTKAKKTGVYVTNGVPQRFKQGDVLPDGAELREANDEPLIVTPRQTEKQMIENVLKSQLNQRAKGAAPENRSK